jgi:L-rhamnose mutarotase
MKNTKIRLLLHSWVLPLMLVVLAAGCATNQQPVKRVGMVIGIQPDKIAAYEQLHADSNPGVRDLLDKYHMHNFSIFLEQVNGQWYEFGYYEYTGKDYDADMAKLAQEPRNIAWLKTTDPLQIPLSGSDGWTMMKRVYFNP